MAASRLADVPLDALALVESAIREDAPAQIVVLENADLAGVALHLARLAAILIQARTDEPLEAIALMRIAATPG